VVRKIVNALQGRRQIGGTDGGHRLGHQPFGMHAGKAAGAIGDHHIRIADHRIQRFRVGRQRDRHIGVALVKVKEPGQQPEKGKTGRRGDQNPRFSRGTDAA